MILNQVFAAVLRLFSASIRTYGCSTAFYSTWVPHLIRVLWVYIRYFLKSEGEPDMKIGIKVSVFDSTQQTKMDAWRLQGSKTHLCDIFDALVALKIYNSDTIDTF